MRPRTGGPGDDGAVSDGDDDAPSQESAGRVLGAMALVVLDFFIAIFGVFLGFAMAMGSAGCAYVDCGDQAWVGRGMFVSTYVAGAMFFVTLIGSIVLASRGRPVLTFTAWCCGAQVLVIVIAMMMFGQAGPLQ